MKFVLFLLFVFCCKAKFEPGAFTLTEDLAITTAEDESSETIGVLPKGKTVKIWKIAGNDPIRGRIANGGWVTLSKEAKDFVQKATAADTEQMRKNKIETQTKLFEAARDGKLDVIESLAREGVDMSQFCDAATGTDPIRFAAEFGSKNAPIHIAARFGQLETVQLLSEIWNDSFGTQDGQERFRRKMLNSRTVRGIMQTMGYNISPNWHPYIDLDQKNSRGWTALGIAAKEGHTEIVKFLLEKNAEFGRNDVLLDHQNDLGWNLVHAAAYGGHFGVIEFLAYGNYITPDMLQQKDKNGKTPSQVATEEIKNFLESGVSE